MAAPGFRIDGAKEIERKLRKLEAKLAKKLVRQELRESAKRFKKAIPSEAPVDSGATKRSVKVKAGKRSRNRISVNAQIGEGAFKGDTFYAAFNEYGTRHIEPNPFMLRAFEKIAPSESKDLPRRLWKRIKQELKAK